MTRSPVYSQLSGTLDGLVTIRAFGMQRKWVVLCSYFSSSPALSFDYPTIRFLLLWMSPRTAV